MPSIRLSIADVENGFDEYLSFDLKVQARVYVGYDAVANDRPRWLRDWQRDEKTLEVGDEWRSPRIMKLYSKVFDPGPVILGGNKARGFAGEIPTNYIVIVKALI